MTRSPLKSSTMSVPDGLESMITCSRLMPSLGRMAVARVVIQRPLSLRAVARSVGMMTWSTRSSLSGRPQAHFIQSGAIFCSLLGSSVRSTALPVREHTMTYSDWIRPRLRSSPRRPATAVPWASPRTLGRSETVSDPTRSRSRIRARISGAAKAPIAWVSSALTSLIDWRELPDAAETVVGLARPVENAHELGAVDAGNDGPELVGVGGNVETADFHKQHGFGLLSNENWTNGSATTIQRLPKSRLAAVAG